MNNNWMDVHGAGAQRAEMKSGDPSIYSTGHGPQGDAVRVYNYARCVTGGTTDEVITGGEIDPNAVANSEFASGSPQAQAGQQTGQPSGNNLAGAAGSNQLSQSGPPQEAIDACTGLSAGATCSVGPGSGTCENIQNQLVLQRKVG